MNTKKSDSAWKPVNLYTALSLLLLAKNSPSIANIKTGTTAANASTSATDTIAVSMSKLMPFLLLDLSRKTLMPLMVDMNAFFSADKLLLSIKRFCFTFANV